MTEDRKEGKPNADGDRNASDSPPQELVSYIADAARAGDLRQLMPFELNAKIASVLRCDGDKASRLRRAWNLTSDGLRGVVRARHNASQAELEHRVMSLASASRMPACSHGDTSAREAAPTAHPDERRRDAGDAPAPLGASHQPSPAHIEAMRRGASELVGRIEDQQRAAELHALSVVQGIQAEA
ncbi:MAG: hypothetical protein KC492_35460, partial [Myxococcales bacterium]|nr:hypothetical protein [Myxococcales bacterium]